jgi:hypothetical protein
MQKSPYDITITIAIVCVITIYPILPTLAYGQQRQQKDLFPFSYPTTTTTTSKNETNNDIQSESVISHTLSSHDKKE